MNITQKIGELIDEIETSSQNQAYDVELINTGMIEIDQRIKDDGSNAEIFASAAEKMNTEARKMNENIQELISVAGAKRTEALAHKIK